MNAEGGIQTYSISGKIIEKSTGKPLSGAHIVLESTYLSTFSDATGNYKITNLKPGTITIRISFVGFKNQRVEVKLLTDTVIDFQMEGSIMLGEEVNIVATRAQEKTPTTFSTITAKEIIAMNLGKDMPYILQSTPSVVVTSDAGNGIGYTGINIRGTDLTRINVTVNGVPLNDAESQGVWFVDLPDLASSIDNVQVQRGVGTSTNGSGAFGATINLQTSVTSEEPYGELNLSGGSFNTFKSTLRLGTGLMANKFSIDGRLSYISSDGYIDRASSKLKSYYVAGGYYGKSTTIKLIAFSGFEKTYQAWEGVPKDSLATNRTYNPAGQYIDQNGQIVYYDNQTDNYQQDHFQLIFSQSVMKNWNVNLALHYTKGKGYYENYKQNEAFADYGLNNVIIGSDTIAETNLVNRKMMNNDFCGLIFSTNYSIPEKLKLTIGGAWSRYYGRHYGNIIWAEYASNGNNERDWYYNTGLKKDFNLFLKLNYSVFKHVNLYADLQYRYAGYKMNGTLDDLRTLNQDHQFNFFNPKAGIFYSSEGHQAYFSFGVAHREPSRNNYKDADPTHMPTYETLYDYELGYNFEIPNFMAKVNLYFMNYHNQLVLTGEINNVGEAVMVNVPSSYRAGIELVAGVQFFRKLQWTVNATFSRNRIRNFTEYVDDYDSTAQKAFFLGETNLSFSPGIVLSSILTYKPFKNFSIGLNSRYIGKQYIDNTSNPSHVLQPYFINGLTIGYSFKLAPFKEIGFNLSMNNLFGARYETNGWVYQYYSDGQRYEVNGYFPQALFNFLFGLTLKI